LNFVSIMKYLVVVLTLAALAFSKRPVDDGNDGDTDLKDEYVRPQFEQHVQKYDRIRQITRSYKEVKGRFINFKKNSDMIKMHNKKGKSYRMGPNMFMTMTPEERKLRTGLANVTSAVHKRSLSFRSRLQLREAPAPETHDHRDYDRVSPVVNQEDCGSCWTYGTVYPLEAAVSILSGKPAVALSVQEILSCTYEEDKDRNGCDGGWYMDGWDYVMKSGRLAADAEYPYAEMDLTCNPSVAKKPNALKDYQIVEYDRVPKGDDSKLLHFSSKHVLAVAVESLGLFFYTSGLFKDEYCESPAAVDHAMTMVGYDREAWVVKNSWGAEWGEMGYVRMSRELPNHCGISDYAYFPIVEKKEEEMKSKKGDKKKKKKRC